MTDSPTPDLNPVTNPDAQEGRSLAHANSMVLLLPLSSGNIAVFGRDFQLHTILYDAPSMEEIRRLSRELLIKSKAARAYDAESRFYGEPGSDRLARDIRRADREGRTIRRTSTDESLEL